MTISLIIAAIGITYAITAHYCSKPYDEYFELTQKYAEAASLLTSMRSEIDSLREKLELSEDVRNVLGIQNAKLAEEIASLKRDADKASEVRFWLMGQLNTVVNDKWRLENALKSTQRSLRIARHKEFKRWKKARKREYIDSSLPLRHTDILTSGFDFFEWIMADRIRRFLPYKDRDHAAQEIAYGKKRLREIAAKLHTMPPYPLP